MWHLPRHGLGIETMDQVNALLFPVFNAGANPPPAIVALARFSADWLLYIVVLGLILAWIRQGADDRRRVLDTVLTAVIALAINFAIAASWYHPRPFELGIGHQLLAHGPETSFPSDHATILFAIALGMIRARGGRLWSFALLASALAVAWARVYLGVHWPMDMVGSFAVALGAAALVGRVSDSRPVAALRLVAFGLYDGCLDLMRIPPRLSPRSGRGSRS